MSRDWLPLSQKTKFIQLKKLFNTLHGPRGCLWDKKQTHASILLDLREEVDEFIREVRRKDYHRMKEELGDLLLHVMFHAQIAAKHRRFDIEDVIDTLIKKLVRRHPHVFGKVKVNSTRQIIANWHKIKKEEKRHARTQRNKGRQ